MNQCSEIFCDSLARTKGLCPTHYQQRHRGYTSVVADNSEHQKCAVSHCSLPASTRAAGSYCRGHYQVAYRGVDPETRISRGPDTGKTEKACWVKECGKRAITHGMCNYHDRRARTGAIEVPAELGVRLNGPCYFDGCDRPYMSKGLCHTHYSQLRTTGKLAEVREYGKYKKGEHICGVASCKKPSISQNLCTNHKALQSQYGLTPGQMIDLWRNPVCSNPGCGQTTRLHMDHDHVTGKFRALLCSPCNTSLGFLKESPERIRGLAAYIERFQE